jgi:hypothetical protein
MAADPIGIVRVVLTEDAFRKLDHACRMRRDLLNDDVTVTVTNHPLTSIWVDGVAYVPETTSAN